MFGILYWSMTWVSVEAWETSTYWGPMVGQEPVREETEEEENQERRCHSGTLVPPDTSSVIDGNLCIVLNLSCFSLTNEDNMTFKSSLTY